MPKFKGPTPTFQTARLVLRGQTIDDAPVVQRNFEQWEVVRYLNKSVPWPYPPDGAVFHFEEILEPAMAAGEERAWAIILEEKMIGSISICTETDENRGFWLAPEHWGKGYMAEASARVTDYVMGELGWEQLMTGNAAANEASARIKRAQGFKRVAVFSKEFVGGVMEYEQWRLTKQAWLDSRASAPPGCEK